MPLKKPPTLADLVYQQTHFEGFKNSSILRQKLFQAKRFVLDQSMSRFLADLYIAAFVRKGKKVEFTMSSKVYDTSWAEGGKLQRHLIEQLRISARLPHAITWIEYDRRAECKRQHEIVENNPFALPRTRDGVEPPCIEGWLLEQHPTIATTFKCDLFMLWPDEGFLMAHAWTYYWMCDDQKLPWPDLAATPDRDIAWHICALNGYHSAQCNYATGHYMDGPMASRAIISIRTGILRHVWSLLTTINDIPVLMREVRPSKGFMARGSYKRFLDHKTITLNVPAQIDRRLLARRVVSDVRRRAHMVRGHWRSDWRHMPHRLCQHDWTIDGECKRCKGHRMWIREHQRGDPSVGILVTDYEVHHEK
jgi:hypothetical protein